MHVLRIRRKKEEIRSLIKPVIRLSHVGITSTILDFTIFNALYYKVFIRSRVGARVPMAYILILVQNYQTEKSSPKVM